MYGLIVITNGGSVTFAGNGFVCVWLRRVETSGIDTRLGEGRTKLLVWFMLCLLFVLFLEYNTKFSKSLASKTGTPIGKRCS